VNARKRRTSNARHHLVVGLLQEVRRRLRSEDGFDDLTEYRDLIDEDEFLQVLVSTLLERTGRYLQEHSWCRGEGVLQQDSSGLWNRSAATGRAERLARTERMSAGVRREYRCRLHGMSSNPCTQSTQVLYLRPFPAE
jgi:hypothetical protein